MKYPKLPGRNPNSRPSEGSQELWSLNQKVNGLQHLPFRD